MDVTFTSMAAGEVLLANLTDELRTGKQAQLRKVLLQIAAAVVSSRLIASISSACTTELVRVRPVASPKGTGLWIHIIAQLKDIAVHVV